MYLENEKAKNAYERLEATTRELLMIGEHEALIVHLSLCLDRSARLLTTEKQKRKLKAVNKALAELVGYFTSAAEKERDELKVYFAVKKAEARGRGISPTLFEEIGEALGMGSSTAQGRYYDFINSDAFKEKEELLGYSESTEKYRLSDEEKKAFLQQSKVRENKKA